MGDFQVGTDVTFTCELNKDKMPQARDTRYLNGMRPGPPLASDELEQCKFFAEGRCTKGSSCAFRHGAEEKELPEAKAKAKAKGKAGRRGNRNNVKKKAAASANGSTEPEPPGAVGHGDVREKVSTRLGKSLEELIAEDRGGQNEEAGGTDPPQSPASAAEPAPARLDKPLDELVGDI